MIKKVLRHGKGRPGCGRRLAAYLTGMYDHAGRPRETVEVLRGNPEQTAALIDSIENEWKYTSLVLAWHPDDEVSPEAMQDVLSAFESAAFAGLSKDQFTFLAVRRHPILPP